ncbi:MAG: hypothetical protein JWM99_2125 [Verrucomicrobiales bacterium]|jgi:hypothetical protein|nr:hypothetical protein [Verrucomicrobiales bacterium]
MFSKAELSFMPERAQLPVLEVLTADGADSTDGELSENAKKLKN